MGFGITSLSLSGGNDKGVKGVVGVLGRALIEEVSLLDTEEFLSGELSEELLELSDEDALDLFDDGEGDLDLFNALYS